MEPVKSSLGGGVVATAALLLFLIGADTLLGGTELLLLDEPTEGLAPLIVEDVRDAILRLKEELTIVLVEQNVKMALDVADHVFVVSNGRNVYESTTDGLDPDDEVLKEHVAV